MSWVQFNQNKQFENVFDYLKKTNIKCTKILLKVLSIVLYIIQKENIINHELSVMLNKCNRYI